MPRIAVAILVVAAIGGGIAVNTAKFPAVWRMMDGSRAPAASKSSEAVLVPTEAKVSPSEPIDLGAVAPPAIDDQRPDARDPIAVPVSSSSQAAAEGDGWGANDSSAGGGAMHVVAEPPHGAGGSASGGEVGGATPTDDSRGMESMLSNAPAQSPGVEGTRGAAPSPATPIVFGPGPSYRGNATRTTGTLRAPGAGASPGPTTTSGMRGAASGSAIGFDASTTWPAQMSPTLKFTRKPALPEAPPSEPDATGDERPLVPVVWPDRKRPSEKAKSTAVSSSVVERLPPVEPPAAIPGKGPRPPAETPIPIYPSTGK
jgi:hypothetical protein